MYTSGDHVHVLGCSRVVRVYVTTYTYSGVHVLYMYTYGPPDEWCTCVAYPQVAYTRGVPGRSHSPTPAQLLLSTRLLPQVCHVHVAATLCCSTTYAHRVVCCVSYRRSTRTQLLPRAVAPHTSYTEVTYMYTCLHPYTYTSSVSSSGVLTRCAVSSMQPHAYTAAASCRSSTYVIHASPRLHSCCHVLQLHMHPISARCTCTRMSKSVCASVRLQEDVLQDGVSKVGLG
jgi:hypothetical protein